MIKTNNKQNKFYFLKSLYKFSLAFPPMNKVFSSGKIKSMKIIQPSSVISKMQFGKQLSVEQNNVNNTQTQFHLHNDI